MPQPLGPVPAALGDAFTRRDAEAAGMGAGRIRAADKPFRGVRARRMPTALAERARAASLVLPDGTVFSHGTAARLLDLWLPPGVDDDLHVMVPPRTRAPRRTGIRAHTGTGATLRLGGVEVSAPAEVFAQLAPHLPVLSLAVLGDSVVRWRSPYTVDDLNEALRDGTRGVRRARRALGLVRPGSNSARESLTRIHLLDAGLPEPELNAMVRAGGRREYLDLLWRERRVAAEYHGGYHFASHAQRLADLDRISWLRRQGFTVVEVTKLDLSSRARLDAVIDELAAVLGVEPLPHHERGRTWRETRG